MGRRSNRRRRHKRSGGNIFGIFIVVALVIAGIVVYMGMTSSKKTYRSEGIECSNNGEYDKAIEWYNSALEEEQWFAEDIDLDIRYYLAESYLHTGQYDKALDQYNILIDDGMNYENTLFYQELTIAFIAYQNGEYDKAIKTMNEAINRGYDNLYVFVGSCYGLKGEYQNMFDNFEKYIAVYGETSFTDSQYATAYMNLGEYSKAIDYVRNGLNLEDKTYRRELLLNEIAYYEYMADYKEAFDKVEKFLEEFPDDEDGNKEYDFLYTRV